MKRYFGISAGLLAVSAAAYPAAAVAAPNDTIALRLRANVAPFCKIWFDNANESINIVNGSADIGSVREVCNTRFGYTIQANFVNLNTGTLNAGGETTAVDNMGMAKFNYGEAGANTRVWRLSDASPVATASPVYMQVVISPI